MRKVFQRLFDVPIYYRNPEELRHDGRWRWFYFNEAVGFVWLEPRSNAIRAEYCFIRQRPTRVLVRREFEPRGKLFQVSCAGLTNTEIFSRLLVALMELQVSGFLERFWIDLGAFNLVGPHIDWRHLVHRKRTQQFTEADAALRFGSVQMLGPNGNVSADLASE